MRTWTSAFCLLLSPVIAVATAAPGPAALSKLFPREAPLYVDRNGLSRLELPVVVLKACRPDLADLRIFGVDGNEIPFVVESGDDVAAAGSAEQTVEGRVLDVRREEVRRKTGPPLYRETYEIEVPREQPEGGQWELGLSTGRPRFVREISVAAVDAAGLRTVLVQGSSVFRLDGGRREKTRLPLPAFAAERLEVTLEGEGGTFLEPGFRFLSRRHPTPSTRRAMIPLRIVGRKTRDGRTVIRVARPAGVVPDLLRVETSSAFFDRQVQIWDERSGLPAIHIGTGEIYRFAGEKEADRIDVPTRAARGEELRIEIEDRDSPPLEGVHIIAVLRRPALLFFLRSSGGDSPAATLRFGGGRAHRPRYDVERLIRRQHRESSGEHARSAARRRRARRYGRAWLGSVGRNPFFDTTPALAFAMRAGAAVDTRLYSHARSLVVTPSREGLTRVALSAVDVARARADLADLRVVDAQGRQWPYLLARRARQVWHDIDLPASTREGGSSHYRIPLPASVVSADGLTLGSDVPFFNRRYRLVTLSEGGRERVLARGRLRHDARWRRPVLIRFDETRLSNLELVVEDGNDAPLDFRAARLRLSLPELFLAAAAGRYRLLVGQPEAQAPHYELEQVREVILSAGSAPATVGDLRSNPDFSRRARLASGKEPRRLLQRLLVWGVLLLAVLVLGAITLRIVREEAPPAGGGDT